ncbi:hypothetical protein DEQ16_14015, partial [Dietzia maris]
PGGDAVAGIRASAATGWRSGVRAVATVDPRAVAVHAAPADTASASAPGPAGTVAPAAPPSPAGPASAHSPVSSPRNAWPARVVSLAPAGAQTRVTAELRDGQRIDAEITTRSAAELALAPGVPVTLIVKATQVVLYPRG